MNHKLKSDKTSWAQNAIYFSILLHVATSDKKTVTNFSSKQKRKQKATTISYHNILFL